MLSWSLGAGLGDIWERVLEVFADVKWVFSHV